MKQCIVCDQSLRFSRTVYGALALTAFLIDNYWIVLATSILMLIGAFTIKYNILYQVYSFIIKYLLGKKGNPIEKNKGELSFSCVMGGSFLLLGFLILYFGQGDIIGWSVVLMTSLLMFFAGLGGICVASLMYAVFKKTSSCKNKQKCNIDEK